jgi:hypothetical protein
MDTIGLDDLVAVWEYWTGGDPLLRDAVQRRPAPSTCRDAIQEQLLERLCYLATSTGADDAGVAVAGAIGAVWLALDQEHCTRSKGWLDMRRDALHAHQDALAEQRAYAPALAVPCPCG